MATNFGIIRNGARPQFGEPAPRPEVTYAKMNGYQRRSQAMASAETPSKAVITTETDKAFKPLANPLHDYATYTYGLTLSMLSAEEFESLQSKNVDELPNWSPKYVMISSAGRFNTAQSGSTPGRLPQFLDDFYFENFNLTTVVGMNSQTRGTNAVEISFTIIEPYGLTLLDRLIDASTGSQINSKNYIAQPYLLDLDFFGASDLGDQAEPLSNLKKRFPIKIVELKIKASSRGSEYSIKAIPFNHIAFQESAVTTPVNLEVTASTVGNFFNSISENAIVAQRQQRESNNVNYSAMNRSIRQGADTSTYANKPTSLISASKPYNVISYTDAVNDWNDMLVSEQSTVADKPDSISFEFHGFDEISVNILESKIVMPEAPNRVRAMHGNNPTQSAQSQSTDGLTINSSNVQVFNINAGTSVIDVINMVMRNSEYIKRQIVDVKGNKSFKDNTYVNFYKVIPQIVKLDYDFLRKRYATKAVYHIVYYKYFNVKHPNLPYVNPTSAVKEYNYIYTGKNLDIIDFAIDFDAAFVSTVVALPGNVNAGNNLANEDEGNDSMNPAREKLPSTEIGPQGWVATPQDAKSGAYAARTGEEHLVANAISSIYSSSRGDMINVKLKIIGDPHFIKQDDIFTNPGQTGFKREVVGANGTIATDYSDIFCRITFKSPTDIDEATGLMRTDGSYAVSKFSGFYKILTVSSEFSKGQFVQTLTCVRMLERTMVKNTAPRDSVVTTDDSASRKPTQEPEQNFIGIDPGNSIPNLRKMESKIDFTRVKELPNDRFSQESSNERALRTNKELQDARRNRNN